MAHAIETMFSVREKPWHYEMTKDKTKIIQQALTSKEALHAAGLDWTVDQTEVYTDSGVMIPGYKANRRSTDNKILGIVSDRYRIVQNTDAFEFTDALVGETENGVVRYETAGSLNGGKRIWLLAKMPTKEIAGDATEPYLVFSNTHDGSGSVNVALTPVRVVCNNTLNLALNHAQRKWSARHIGRIEDKLMEARSTLLMANDYMDKLAEKADQLANTPLYMDELSKIIDAMFPVDESMSKRKKSGMEQLKEGFYACYLRPDIAQFMNTGWGAINAMSDFVGHGAPLRNTKDFEANRFGKIMDGHPVFDRFVSLVNAKVAK